MKLRLLMLLGLAGCAHNGTLSTPYSNTLIIGRAGIPEFLGQANRCPSGLGDGNVQKSWTTSGKKMFSGKCSSGLMVGAWTAYFENGATEWTAHFEAGVLTGEFHSFYANDQKRAKVSFAEGLPTGAYKSWHFNGEKEATGQFVGGKKNGCWETWHENGKQASKGTWSDDTQVETWLYWTPEGQRRKEKLGGDAAHGGCLFTL
jgi:hypothetical protein